MTKAEIYSLLGAAINSGGLKSAREFVAGLAAREGGRTGIARGAVQAFIRDFCISDRLSPREYVRGLEVLAGLIEPLGIEIDPSEVMLSDNAAGLELLLADGLDPDGVDFEGKTWLCVAASYGADDCFMALAKAGADLFSPGVDAARSRHVTPLMHAASSGSLTIVRYLLRFTVNPNGNDWLDRNALHYAKATVIPLLIGAGVKLEQRDCHGSSPLVHLARRAPYDAASEVVRDTIDRCSLLIDAGAKAGASARGGFTIYHPRLSLMFRAAMGAAIEARRIGRKLDRVR